MPSKPGRPDSGERLQKFLAARGAGSRREVETWIADGRITVDGKTAVPGTRVSVSNAIRIDGKTFATQQKPSNTRVILYNKPEGEICTRSDPAGRPTVFRQLPRLKGGRWVAVGRLDINTCGLILFTNDGELANHLMHPRTGIEREYLCRVYGDVSRDKIQQLTEGVPLDGKIARFLQVRRQGGQGRNAWYSVIVGEGRYREVRRIWEAVDCKVSRLTRTRYGKLGLPRGMKQGSWIELSRDMIKTLSDNKDDGQPVVTPKPDRNRKRSRGRR